MSRMKAMDKGGRRNITFRGKCVCLIMKEKGYPPADTFDLLISLGEPVTHRQVTMVYLNSRLHTKNANQETRDKQKAIYVEMEKIIEEAIDKWKKQIYDAILKDEHLMSLSLSEIQRRISEGIIDNSSLVRTAMDSFTRMQILKGQPTEITKEQQITDEELLKQLSKINTQINEYKQRTRKFIDGIQEKEDTGEDKVLVPARKTDDDSDKQSQN